MNDTTIAANKAIDKLQKDIDDFWANTGYTKAIVAIIDVMGIKELFLRNPHDFAIHNSIYKSWDKILKTQELEEYKIDINEKYGELGVKTTILSDSIVLSIDINVPNAFTKVFMMIGLFCNSLFLLSEPYFTRGAVVVGDIYHKDNIVFGPALIKAHLLEKDKAVNFRYIIHKDDFLELSNYTGSEFKCVLDAFFYFSDGFYCYDYLYRFLYYAENRIIRNKDNPQIYINSLNRISNKFENEIANNKNSGVPEKYKWLKTYFYSTINKALKASENDDFVWLRNTIKRDNLSKH